MTTEPASVHRPPAHRKRHVSPASAVWVAVPLVTLGMGTWAAFLYAAIRRRSWWLGGASAIYAALVAAWLAADTGPVGSAVGGIAFIACAAGGFANALAVRARVFAPARPRQGDPLHAAEEEALRRRKLRAEARDLLRRDPALARELAIGRPDLPRHHDDGGVIDVNHVPAAVLATLPGITPELAGRLVSLRTARGPFVSADEVSMELGLPPDAIQPLADLTIYPT